ncbi:MAG TPA: hypothetical protein VHN11_07935 [Xanthobacteraceae bacterium]|nr:hypothetical protein [Xanthobacteraceae bacterium]
MIIEGVSARPVNGEMGNQGEADFCKSDRLDSADSPKLIDQFSIEF